MSRVWSIVQAGAGVLSCALTISLFTADIASGQSISQISGTVRDDTGAIVPDVQVTATDTDTGVKRTVVTDSAGYYVLTNLPVGPYRIEATKMGFRNFVQTGIELQVGSAPELPITLGVGAVTETVQVEANAAQVDTRTVGVGAVVENQRVVDLPLNGRDPSQLIALSGAAVQGSANPGFDMRTGYQFAVAGGNATGVQYYWDGANYIDLFSGTGMLLPFPDALLEFRLSSSAQDASNAGQGAATINAVTKSGTNSFHGDVFEFIRNYDVNARDFFSTGPDGLKRNQFGGTFGGPLKKDKFFFFLGYQGTTVRQTPVGSVQFVPTAQELAGNFAAFASPECQNGVQVHLRGPFVNNQISPALFNPAAVAIAKLLPQGTGPCGAIIVSTPLHENDNQGLARVDYQHSDKQSMFARTMIAKQQAVVPYTLDATNILTDGGVGNNDQESAVILGDTYVVSPSEVNSTRLFFNRISAILPGASAFGAENVGINDYTYQPNYLPVNVIGGFYLGSGQFSENSFAYTTDFGVNEDFTVSRGSHVFAFGGYFLRTIEWSVAQAWSAGSWTFAPALSGLGMSDFFLGFAAQFREANPNPLNVRQNSMALYAQDTWKVTPRLTLNYGVNWDPFFGQSFPQGDVYTFSLSNFYQGIRSKAIPNAPPGFLFPGDPGFYDNSGIQPTYTYFNPRVGLAWDPSGGGKTAIRLGGGISHDVVPLDLDLNDESVSPFRLTVVSSGVNLSNPWANYPGGDPFPYNYNRSNPFFAPYGSYLPIPENMKAHVEYSWNLGVQRQVTPAWFVSATYLGNHIIHIWDAVELNPAEYIPGNCAAGQYGLTAPGPCTNSSNINQRRVLNLTVPGTQIGYLTQYDDGGTQSYNGLLLVSTVRLRNNLSLNANYTWSHCIGLPDIAVAGVVLNPGQNYFNQGYGQNVGPANRNLDIGNCVLDRRHVANITLVYQTPRFSNSVARRLASGWSLSSIVVAQSGAPYILVSGTTPDPATGFGGNPPGDQRLNYLGGSAASATQGQACANIAPCISWLNPAAFAAPALGTFGNMAPYDLVGPSFWEWDQMLSRQFQITERHKLELRAEAYNVTNSLRLGTPGTTLSSGTFGLITADATPDGPTTAPARVYQFALKYVF
jgi:Carboxypeptidase regulatory-like domain/TonB dependent receptor